MPTDKFYFPCNPPEQTWGKAIFGDDWEGPQTEPERNRLNHFYDPRTVYETFVPRERPIDASPLEHWEYRGPEADRQQAEADRKRALKKRAQREVVQRKLLLLRDYGHGCAPQPGTLFFSDYDPLELLPDDPDLRDDLDHARLLYWTLKRQHREAAVADAAPTESVAPVGDKPARNTIAAETACRAWLAEKMRAEPRSALHAEGQVFTGSTEAVLRAERAGI